MNGLDEKNVIVYIFCIIILFVFIADKNKTGSNLSTGFSIESNTTGSMVAASSFKVSVTKAAVKTKL